MVGLVLLLAACDDLRVPAPPAQVTNDTALVAVSPARPAKPAARKPAGVDPLIAARRFEDIQRGLRRLVVAEETYYAENGIYTQDPTRLGFTPPGGSQVRFLWVGRDGWAASGTHEDVPGRDCVIYVGRERAAPTTTRDARRGREGVPACDRLPGRDTRVAAAPSSSAAPPSASGGEPSEPSVADTGSALDMVEPTIQMRVDLRNLVRSQDTWYGTQGVYSRRTEPFALQYLWHRGVAITILSANDVSWSARATHASRPGKSCVIWFGPVATRPVTQAQRRTPERPAVPACDE
ncbi:MAG TPA: hypothetical protein VHR43_12570 [Gemmatimonadales bacterium]|nr:hypothetical protein [Gemmatimonadales bacterium]